MKRSSPHWSVEHKVEEEDEMQPNVVGHRSRRPGGRDDTGYWVIVYLGKNLGSRKICWRWCYDVRDAKQRTQEVLKSISLQPVDKGDVNENLIEQDGKMLGFKDRRWALPFPALLLTPHQARTARYIHSWIKHFNSLLLLVHSYKDPPSSLHMFINNSSVLNIV